MAVETDCEVLVVEDHGDTSEMLKRTLARHGIAAQDAHTSGAALDFLERRVPKCVILDEAMPDMTGLTLYRRMLERAEWKDIPVFFYTACYDWRKQMEAEQLGIRGWFVKGISRVPDLMERVLDVCQKG